MPGQEAELLDPIAAEWFAAVAALCPVPVLLTADSRLLCQLAAEKLRLPEDLADATFAADDRWRAHLAATAANGRDVLDRLVIANCPYRVTSVRGPGSMYIHQFHDLGEHDRELARAQHQQQQVEAGQKMTSIVRLAGSVAHDLNNVMTAIMGLVWVLRQDLGEDHQNAEEVQGIVDALERGRGLTRELLEQVRIHKLYKQRYAVPDVIERVRGLLRVVKPAGIDIDVEVAEDLPWLEGDAVAIGHALMNICRNAIDAMPTGGRVVLAARAEAGEQPRVVLEVRDTGDGMDADTCNRASDPYFTTRANHQGLGLAKVTEVVHGHGGELEIESVEGGGTTARLLLPIR